MADMYRNFHFHLIHLIPSIDTFLYHHINVEIAINTQKAATYPLFLSPILAAFHGIPATPVLHLSIQEGKKCLIYVQVQINNKMTTIKLEKSNNADIFSLWNYPVDSNWCR